MNSTVKEILLWVLILVAAVGLYNFVEHSSSPGAMLSLTDFLNKVEAGQVAEVEINGSNLMGKYTAGGSNIPVHNSPGVLQDLRHARSQGRDRQDYSSRHKSVVGPPVFVGPAVGVRLR